RRRDENVIPTRGATTPANFVREVKRSPTKTGYDTASVRDKSVSNPIFDTPRFRRELAEARALEEQLRLRFDITEAGVIVGGAALDKTKIDMTGAPSTFWAAILDFAAARLAIEALLASVERNLRPAPQDADMRAVLDGVRQVDRAAGSLSP